MVQRVFTLYKRRADHGNWTESVINKQRESSRGMDMAKDAVFFGLAPLLFDTIQLYTSRAFCALPSSWWKFNEFPSCYVCCGVWCSRNYRRRNNLLFCCQRRVIWADCGVWSAQQRCLGNEAECDKLKTVAGKIILLRPLEELSHWCNKNKVELQASSFPIKTLPFDQSKI